jgi:hypothetical protein
LWGLLKKSITSFARFSGEAAKLRKQISIIRIKKSPFLGIRTIKARLALLQQATENSKEEKAQQYRQNTQKRTAGKNKLRKQKTEEGFKSACPTCGIRGNTKEVTFI